MVERWLAFRKRRDDIGKLRKGVVQALVATGVGLFVAIPAVVVYNVLQEKIAATESSVASFRKIVLASLHLLDAPAAASEGGGGSRAAKGRARATLEDESAAASVLH